MRLLINTKKKQSWKKTCEEIENCRGNTRANKAWKVLKSMRTQNRDTAGISLISSKQWTTCYQELLTEDRDEFLNPSIVYEEETDHIPNISSEEVVNAMENMKNGRAPGPGNLNVSL